MIMRAQQQPSDPRIGHGCNTVGTHGRELVVGGRRKTTRRALTDRASRRLSRMTFKSKHDKCHTQSNSSHGIADASDGTVGGAQSEDASKRDATAAIATSDAAAADSAKLTKLVLKFTTAAESNVQPSCEISTAGASIGQSGFNTVSIPSDSMLAPLDHAHVQYGLDNRSEDRQTISCKNEEFGFDGEDANGRPRKTGVGFFLRDGGQRTDFAAAVRVHVGEGNRKWPLREGSHFSAGLSVFRVTRLHLDVRDHDHTNDGGSGCMTLECGDWMKAGAEDCNEPTKSNRNERDASADKLCLARSSRDESSTRGKRLRIEALAGCLKGRVWHVGTTGATVGRANDNELCLSDKEMSRLHSKIEYDPRLDEFFLCDMGSLNGTYMQLVGPYAMQRKLNLGDHLLIGRTGFSVNRYDYGISERMGARPAMEDRSTVIQDLGLSSLAGSRLWPQTFAGVYDGHGGGEASEYLWSNLHVKVADSLAARSKQLLSAVASAKVAGGFRDASLQHKSNNYCLLTRAGLRKRGGLEAGNFGSRKGANPCDELDEVVKEAIREAFTSADQEFMTTSRLPEAGSTATTCLILGRRLYIANVGDSRTILCRNGKLRLASQDHKPSRADEHARVQKAGGFVAHRRVMGELAVSRAFGDAEFKRLTAVGDSWRESVVPDSHSQANEVQDKPGVQLITAEPEFLISEIAPQDQFAALACDGLFDVMSSEEVVGEIFNTMKTHADAQRCCEDLTERAIVEHRTRDNVSLVLLVLNKWY